MMPHENATAKIAMASLTPPPPAAHHRQGSARQNESSPALELPARVRRPGNLRGVCWRERPCLPYLTRDWLLCQVSSLAAFLNGRSGKSVCKSFRFVPLLVCSGKTPSKSRATPRAFGRANERNRRKPLIPLRPATFLVSVKRRKPAPVKGFPSFPLHPHTPIPKTDLL